MLRLGLSCCVQAFFGSVVVWAGIVIWKWSSCCLLSKSGIRMFVLGVQVACETREKF